MDNPRKSKLSLAFSSAGEFLRRRQYRERPHPESARSAAEPSVSTSAPVSSSGVAGRIVRAASAQGVNQAARIVQLFLLVPICLTAWGTGVYEDWLLLNSIAAFLMLGDLGFGQLTTVRLIAAW